MGAHLTLLWASILVGNSWAEPLPLALLPSPSPLLPPSEVGMSRGSKCNVLPTVLKKAMTTVKHEAWPHVAVRAEKWMYSLAFIGRDAFYTSFLITNFVSYSLSRL